MHKTRGTSRLSESNPRVGNHWKTENESETTPNVPLVWSCRTKVTVLEGILKSTQDHYAAKQDP